MNSVVQTVFIRYCDCFDECHEDTKTRFLIINPEHEKEFG
jgi:hypothetical protein